MQSSQNIAMYYGVQLWMLSFELDSLVIVKHFVPNP